MSDLEVENEPVEVLDLMRGSLSALSSGAHCRVYRQHRMQAATALSPRLLPVDYGWGWKSDEQRRILPAADADACRGSPVVVLAAQQITKNGAGRGGFAYPSYARALERQALCAGSSAAAAVELFSRVE